jgi:hypothetical protein
MHAPKIGLATNLLPQVLIRDKFFVFIPESVESGRFLEFETYYELLDDFCNGLMGTLEGKKPCVGRNIPGWYLYEHGPGKGIRSVLYPRCG